MNPRISPKVPISTGKKVKKSVNLVTPIKLMKPVKPLIILSFPDQDVYVPKHHLMDPTKGLTIFQNNNSTNKPKSFVLCPRKFCLDRTAQLNNLATTTAICNALDELEKATRSTSKRGGERHVMHDRDNKYVGCVGSQVRRAGTGVEPIHYTLRSLKSNDQKVIMSLFRQIEHVFGMFIDTEHIRLIKHAIDLINPCTFSTPSCNNHSDIYAALASVRNGYLVTHTDQDMTYGSITIHMRATYQLTDKVVAYFNFPCLGISIPLRPGDVLFFNPREPHCISSRCNNADEIYLLSLYIKSNLFGLNDNDMDLLPGEVILVNEYNKIY